ncbi:AMP-binding protein [Nocardioides bizhenqiangii]|uniref:AMP-binding protein n=1 Tax=Nocardioides bizhenqiangii TaxID=3095076 RepID=A0ABZ0ZR00_9ACTN|nr:AMP-binding protein [Nocardioides sp. HM61]WQQ26219.1 AMP-binding protein [Nocardioides sp. HM61]
MNNRGRLRTQLWATGHLLRSRMIGPMRPDRYVGMTRVLRRYGPHATTGFALAANRRPDATGLVDDRGSLTWQQIQDRADALAVGLAQLSGGQPTSVAILCRNHRGFVDAFLAAGRLGVPGLLLNTGFSGPQLADVLEREQASLIVYDEEFAGLVADARERIPGLTGVLGWVDDEVATREQPTAEQLIAEQLIDAHRGERPPPSRPGRVVILTSGTTGTPKGATRSGGGPEELAAMLERIPWHAEETVVVAAPIFHAWGFGQLVIGATMACTIVLRRRFDPEATLALADQHRATGIALVPVMLERIMELPADVLDRYALDTVRFVTASGSRMRGEAVIAFMDRFGDKVYNSYNATEAGQISVASPADLRHAPDTAGRPVTGTTVKLVDDDGNEVPVGEVGRIVLRGASEFDGYTAGDSKDSLDGFMVSGDVGRMDAEGRLYVVGRDDDMIVSGGENVYPVEVERAIGELSEVREVVVVGVDDEKYGQRLAAYVVPAEPEAVDADRVRAHVKARLAGYKVPRDVVLLDELPRNASGKVVARDLPEPK